MWRLFKQLDGRHIAAAVAITASSAVSMHVSCNPIEQGSQSDPLIVNRLALPAGGKGAKGTEASVTKKEHAQQAVGTTPSEKPVAGQTMGAGTAPEEAPQEKEHDFKPGSFKAGASLPVIPCGRSIVPAVPPPSHAAVAEALKNSKPGPGGARPKGVKHTLTMRSTAKVHQLSATVKYPAWTFDDVIPGPFIRARMGDWFEVAHANQDSTGMGHNIDFHCNMGPGGGAPATYAEVGEAKGALFKLTYPGLYIYHCAAAPLPAHVGNGMYGMILVDPPDGPLRSPLTMLPQEELFGPGGWPKSLPPHPVSSKVPKANIYTPDGRPVREFGVVQSDFYATEESDENDLVALDYQKGLDETPSHIVLNGREGALTENPLVVYAGDRVRLYFGNAGVNATASLHVIGTIFDCVWRDADFFTPPQRGIQTVTVPPGGACVVEFDALVPGSLTIVDHALFRVDKGCVGFIKVLPALEGPEGKRGDLYSSSEPPVFCPGCKLHN